VSLLDLNKLPVSATKLNDEELKSPRVVKGLTIPGHDSHLGKKDWNNQLKSRQPSLIILWKLVTAAERKSNHRAEFIE
jgi:hypothetical protein